MQNTKLYIVKTSLVLFLQKSFKEVTMSEIVQKTGLSKGAFYHYFKSKEELYKEIVSMFFNFGTVDYSIFDQNSLYNFYMQYIDYMNTSLSKIYEFTGIDGSEDARLNFMMIMFEAIRKFPEFLKLEEVQYQKSLESWSNVIENSKKSGEITSVSSSRQIADLFLYCTDGVFLRYINSDKFNAYSVGLKEAFDTIYDNIKA